MVGGSREYSWKDSLTFWEAGGGAEFPWPRVLALLVMDSHAVSFHGAQDSESLKGTAWPTCVERKENKNKDRLTGGGGEGDAGAGAGTRAAVTQE